MRQFFFLQPTIDEPLGSSAMFGSWGKGAMGVKATTQPMTNMYAALENMDSEKRNLGNNESQIYLLIF